MPWWFWWVTAAAAIGVAFPLSQSSTSREPKSMTVIIRGSDLDRSALDAVRSELKNATKLGDAMLPYVAVLQTAFQQVDESVLELGVVFMAHHAPLLTEMRSLWQTAILPAVPDCDSECVSRHTALVALYFKTEGGWNPKRADLAGQYAKLIMPPTRAPVLALAEVLQRVVELWPDTPREWTFIAVP